MHIVCVYINVWIKLYMKSDADQYISKEVDTELKTFIFIKLFNKMPETFQKINLKFSPFK